MKKHAFISKSIQSSTNILGISLPQEAQNKKTLEWGKESLNGIHEAQNEHANYTHTAVPSLEVWGNSSSQTTAAPTGILT